MTLKKRYGLIAELEEGIRGEFFVVIDGETVFTNSRQCCKVPKRPEILEKIEAYLGVSGESHGQAIESEDAGQ